MHTLQYMNDIPSIIHVRNLPNILKVLIYTKLLT